MEHKCDLEMVKRFVPEPVKMMEGDSNKITRRYLDSILINYRHIGARLPITETELFGRIFSTPVMLGGMAAMVPGLHEGGMKEMAKGVAAAGGVFWSGYVSDRQFADAVSAGGSAIRIIKPIRDHQKILDAIRHDEECGAMAFAMDIDHGFDEMGNYHPEVPHGYPELAPKSMEELVRYVKSTKLPFIAKGVLCVEDALACVEAGAKGLLLSHHKGEYPYAVPPLMVLPEIRKAVGNDIYLFVDCGIQTGADVFKALALGADAVCSARVFMKPFAEKGAEGVREQMEKMTGELKGIMGKTCCERIGEITDTKIRFR